MNILKGAITSLASQGRLGLQIPQYDIWIQIDPPIDVDRYEEIPDEWIIQLRNGIPAVGRQEGFLFLTRAGWEANKEKLKEAFESAGRNRRGTWKDFEKHAQNHFSETKEKSRRRIKLYESKLNQLKEGMKQL